MKKRFIIGISGASGSIYALSLIQALRGLGYGIDLVITNTAREICSFEQDDASKRIIVPGPDLVIHDNSDPFSRIASGSNKTHGMVICPCSMKTLSAVANGYASTLMHRAADVMLKESRRLVLVTRETPLSQVHLRNMLHASQAGALIMPACPAFYTHPESLEDMADFMAGRILDQFAIQHTLYSPWEGRTDG
ncbi:MAG: UbiX family flavin prenyltransferase [Thermodesulfobacteriota bacterium]|nr:UbiX family flavin prenyltransferase [Thermodesulfobacteriota bacterium]